MSALETRPLPGHKIGQTLMHPALSTTPKHSNAMERGHASTGLIPGDDKQFTALADM